MSERALAVIMAFGFGVVFVTALLVFVALAPNSTDRQFEVIRIILALVAGGIAAMIPGFLNLKLQTGTKLAVRSGGAIVVLILIYFYLPSLYRYYSEWIDYPAGYTAISGEKRTYDQAEADLQGLVQELRDLAAQNPGGHRPDWP